MSRPKPRVLANYINSKTFIVKEICKAEGVWLVLFNGMPFNYRRSSMLTDLGKTYIRNVHMNPAHAQRLCDRLNKEFRTSSFTVRKVEFEET